MDASPNSDKPMEQVLYEVKKVIVGQDNLLERMIVALLARGHILVEGVPGLAKTMAIKTLAGAIGGAFQRIQFTPDLVPADLIGTRIYNQKTGEFNTSLGPVFTNLLLADADMTGGAYYRAENADQLVDVFRNLPMEIVLQEEHLEISVAFAALGALAATLAIGLSLLWSRYP